MEYKFEKRILERKNKRIKDQLAFSFFPFSVFGWRPLVFSMGWLQRLEYPWGEQLFFPIFCDLLVLDWDTANKTMVWSNLCPDFNSVFVLILYGMG